MDAGACRLDSFRCSSPYNCVHPRSTAGLGDSSWAPGAAQGASEGQLCPFCKGPGQAGAGPPCHPSLLSTPHLRGAPPGIPPKGLPLEAPLAAPAAPGPQAAPLQGGVAPKMGLSSGGATVHQHPAGPPLHALGRLPAVMPPHVRRGDGVMSAGW